MFLINNWFSFSKNHSENNDHDNISFKIRKAKHFDFFRFKRWVAFETKKWKIIKLFPEYRECYCNEWESLQVHSFFPHRQLRKHWLTELKHIYEKIHVLVFGLKDSSQFPTPFKLHTNGLTLQVNQEGFWVLHVKWCWHSLL